MEGSGMSRMRVVDVVEEDIPVTSIFALLKELQMRGISRSL